MANLSTYIDFSIVFDKSVDTPVIRLTDPNNYPAGVGIYLSGIFTIRQPDGITVTGSFTTPDIYWSGSGLVVAEKELRLSTTLAIQKGTYSFTYTVRCIGYTDTTLTKTFNLIYDTPIVSITDLNDVFTPSLKQLDETVYTQPFFPSVSVTRSWSADIKYAGASVANVTGTAALFDMAYSGDYYDAEYDISFEAIMTTTNFLITYLTVIDKVSSDYILDAYTPPSLTVLLTALDLLYTQITNGTYCGNSGCGCCDPVDYSKWTEASQLYQSILADGLAGNTIGLYAKIVHLEKIYYCGIYAPTHTNEIIPAYSFVAIVTVLQNVTLHTVAFQVGQPGAGMVDGDTVYTLADTPVHGSISVHIDGILVSPVAVVGNPYTSIVYTSMNAIISIVNGNVTDGNVVVIDYWKAATAIYGTLDVGGYVFIAEADNTTATGAIAALVGATIVSVVRDIFTLVPAEYSLNSATGEITLLGGGSNFLDTDGRLAILFTTAT